MKRNPTAHALLWQQGVPHGDINLKNLLCEVSTGTGILTDLDLSTVHTPNHRDMRIIGMPPFKPMEWLRERRYNHKVPRRYDHELESFAWVLFWISRRVVTDRKCEQHWRPNDWLDSSEFNVYRSKITLQVPILTAPNYHWLELPLRLWINSWYRHLGDVLDRTSSTEKTMSEHLQAFIDICTECAKADRLVAVPIDVSWVEGARKDGIDV